MTDKPKVTQAEGVGAFQKALRNAEPKHGEVVLHASDWMDLRDAIFNDAATIDRIAAEQSRDDAIEECVKLLELEALKLAPETLTFDAPMQLEKIAVKIGKAAGIFHAVKLLRDNADSLRNLKDNQPTKQSRDVIKAAKRQADNVAFILNRIDLPEHDRQRLERELAEDRETLSKGKKS